MKRAVMCAAVSLAATLVPVFVHTAQEAKLPDFSGMWTLDQDASQFTRPAFSGGRGGTAIERLFITHALNGTLIIGSETNGLKAWSYTPGRRVTIPVGRDTTMTVTSRWEGERIVAEGSRGDMEMREVLSLSPDGRILTIEVTTRTPEGEQVNKLVYTQDQPVGPCESWVTPCKEFSHYTR